MEIEINSQEQKIISDALSRYKNSVQEALPMYECTGLTKELKREKELLQQIKEINKKIIYAK